MGWTARGLWLAVVVVAGCASGGSSRGVRRGVEDAGPPGDSGRAPATDGSAGADGGGRPGLDAGPRDAGPPPVDAGPDCASAPCSPMATCDDASGSAVCTCSAGYAGDGVTCTDVDECAAGTDDCDTNAICTNATGSFTCACNAGYSGDGRTCADIDECSAGSAGCHPNASCTNTPGSFTCTCNSGYTGDGFTCAPIGPVCTSIEGFEAGTWPVSPWVSAGTGGGTVSAGAAHDGVYGITDPDWYYETATTVGATGDTLRAWVRYTGTAGRVYLGFSAGASGCKSFVFAPNTGDVRFQNNAAYGHTELNTTAASFTVGRWYLMEVAFMGGGLVEGRLYDSDGTTRLYTVSQSYASVPVGGVCIRSFNSMNIDTIQRCR